MTDREQQYLDWLFDARKGISSQAIWQHMVRGKVTGFHGNDSPDDAIAFSRCLRLLKTFPEWRERFQEMAQYPVWRRMVAEWNALEDLYRENPDYNSPLTRRLEVLREEYWEEVNGLAVEALKP